MPVKRRSAITSRIRFIKTAGFRTFGSATLCSIYLFIFPEEAVRYYKTNAMIAERTAKRTHVAILGDTCGVRLVLVMDTPPQREFSCSIHETHSPLSNIYLLWPPFRFHGSALVFVGHYFLFLPPSQIYIAITNCYHSTACTSPGHLRLPHCPSPLTRTIRSVSVKHT
ncbi:hypothetical protein B0H13DRAFT_765818 [Mycena leptocephala]|nr:hypothetical protein B0H13DRAFT_765818 [Mycena leptocephala]